MKKREWFLAALLYGVFGWYVFFLMRILFLSRISELFDGQGTIARSINLIPFHSILEYLFSGSAEIRRFSFANVVGNIVLFVPLGMFLPLVRTEKRTRSNLIFLLLVSLLTEVVQWLFGLGTSDIDDVILNCFGGFLGILGHGLLFLILRDKKKVFAAITLLFVLIGVPVLYYLSFVIQLRL